MFRSPSLRDRYDIPCMVTTHPYEIYQESDVDLVHTLLARMARVVVPSQYNRPYFHE